jgi:hypothetical protein
VKTLVLIFLFSIFSSCAQRIKVPINRFISPEGIGSGFQMAYQDTGHSSGVLDFANNNTNNSLKMSSANEEALYLGVGIAPTVDLFVKVHKESSSLIGLKVQVFGTPLKEIAVGHKLAFTMATGSERDEFDDTFTIELKSDVTDYSLIYGYRSSESMMMYLGVSTSNYSFEGTIKGNHGLSNGDIDYQARNIQGAHIGAMLGGASFNLKAEYATQKIKWTNTESKLYQYFALALQTGW